MSYKEFLQTIQDKLRKIVPTSYKVMLRTVTKNNDKVVSESTSGKQHKELLHKLISKITMNKARNIESIELIINSNLIRYLDNGGEPSPDGGGSPLFYILCFPIIYHFDEL
jgi:hypothetical protein